ncbi:MAG: hypothetical protein M3O46_11345 [Myxococcota bacterium]|nr:hypothetical protein [Myxococcota bacterium]
MRSTIRALVLLLPITASCIPRIRNEIVVPTAAEPPPAPTEVREIAVSGEPDDETPAPVASTVAPSPSQLSPPETALFRLGAGYGALAHVDLTPCREDGLQSGYLRVRVTFRHSGRVVRAAVESAIAPPVEALNCISEQLEVAMVPLFDGGDVTLSKSFFVN